MQHDLYSWQVLGGEFIKDELTNSSEFIDKTITDWLKKVGPEQREKFIDTIFEILNTTQAQTLSEIKDKVFSNTKTMVKTYQNLDAETKQIMIKTLEEFLRIGKSNIQIPKLDITNYTKEKTYKWKKKL
jgi:ABC-type transporter MlaC component